MPVATFLALLNAKVDSGGDFVVEYATFEGPAVTPPSPFVCVPSPFVCAWGAACPILTPSTVFLGNGSGILGLVNDDEGLLWHVSFPQEPNRKR